NQAAADAVVADVKAAGRRGIAVKGDMANPEDVEKVFAAVDRDLGRLTHLVHSAGITGPAKRVEALTNDDIRAVTTLNVDGAFYAARAAIPRMSTRHGGKGGSIVLISSMAAVIGGAGEFVIYAASKSA